jgi:hypothetical protein
MSNIFNLLNDDLIDKIFDEVDEYDNHQYEIKMNKIQYNRVMRELKFDFKFLIAFFNKINPFPDLLFSIINLHNINLTTIDEYNEDWIDLLDNYNDVMYDILHTVEKVY